MRRVVALSALLVCLSAAAPAPAADVQFDAAGPLGLAYIGFYYGLVDPGDDSWYVGADLLGMDSKTWMCVADTGASATILGKTTQDAYAQRTPLPLYDYPDVEFVDEGFGGFVSFAVTEPVRLMIADFKAANEAADPEDPALYAAYGPLGAPPPPSIKMAAARELIGGGGMAGIDFDIIGMSAMEGQLLHVDPHYLEFLRLSYLVMAGSLDDPPPSPTDLRALYVPVTLHDYFGGIPQTVDVGRNPILPVHVRKAATDPYATRTALFDTGSGSNFICESFATDAGIDVNSAPDMTVTVIGLGSEQLVVPGWYVDALALDLGGDRTGDRLVIGNTAVFVMADEDMPGDLQAILGNAVFSHATDELGWPSETTVVEWYVDTRNPDEATLIVIMPDPIPLPGDTQPDGCVDGLDYNTWSLNYLATGQSPWFDGGYTVGNFNEDDVVDGLDYNTWSLHYLTGCEAAPIPEPSCVLLILLATPAIFRRRTGHARAA